MIAVRSSLQKIRWKQTSLSEPEEKAFYQRLEFSLSHRKQDCLGYHKATSFKKQQTRPLSSDDENKQLKIKHYEPIFKWCKRGALPFLVWVLKKRRRKWPEKGILLWYGNGCLKVGQRNPITRAASTQQGCIDAAHLALKPAWEREAPWWDSSGTGGRRVAIGVTWAWCGWVQDWAIRPNPIPIWEAARLLFGPRCLLRSTPAV